MDARTENDQVAGARTGSDPATAARAGNEVMDDVAELFRERRAEMALWLALEVLQTDPVALEDEELVERLIACQDRVQERFRARVAGQAGGAGR